jgi:non-ribosomal peptide synthetase component F
MYPFPTERTEPCCVKLPPPSLKPVRGVTPSTEPTLRTPKRLQEFFERTAATKSDNLALICGDQRLTYSALDAQANKLAHYLARHGVRPGDCVGLLLERSVHTYVALLAALKCGAAFVPLDPSFPAERLAFIAKDADLKCLLTTADFRDATAAVSCSVTALDTVAAAVAREPAERLSLPRTDESLAYIIYTSGTTGRPKGNDARLRFLH